MRVFPEDEEIAVFELIESWVGEGFLRPKEGKTLEEVALENLKGLIDRNMILIEESGRTPGEIETCKVHDLLRDLSVREYEKENSFRISVVQKINSNYCTCFICGHREASTTIYLPKVLTASLPTSLAKCFMCNVCSTQCSQYNRLRLVKAVRGYLGSHKEEFEDNFDGDDVEFLQPTRLRYLRLDESYNLESTLLPLLWNLRSLIHYRESSTKLPNKIWEMPQLRHLKIMRAIYVDPPVTQTGRKDSIVLENLHEVSHLRNFKCSEEIIERIPNLRILRICYGKTNSEEAGAYMFHNLTHLHKLEELYLKWKGTNLEEISFPTSLKKLHLRKCNIPWERMTVIGSSPNLEELKLYGVFGGPEWNPVEGEFLRLKFLSIIDSDLVWWNAEKDHFPKLEYLELTSMQCLEEIPSDFGEIETLHLIELFGCNESAVSSAEEMIQEQRSYGNEELQLNVVDYELYDDSDFDSDVDYSSE